VELVKIYEDSRIRALLSLFYLTGFHVHFHLPILVPTCFRAISHHDLTGYGRWKTAFTDLCKCPPVQAAIELVLKAVHCS